MVTITKSGDIVALINVFSCHHATALSLKLFLRENKLTGRILASAASAGQLAILAYAIDFGPSN